MAETDREPMVSFQPTSPSAVDPIETLAAMIDELAEQVDVLTGLVQGQDREGTWMSQELSHLVRSSHR